MELRELTSLVGVAGNEDEVRRAIMRELDSMGIPYETDFLGNIIAKKGTAGPKVLVDAHMDESGCSFLHRRTGLSDLSALECRLQSCRPRGSS